MNKITFVEIQVEGREKPSAFAIFINGLLVALDKDGRFLNDGIAGRITSAVFGLMEYRTVTVSPDWDFDEHVVPALGLRRHYPVVLDVEEDLFSMADGSVRATRAGVKTIIPLREMPSPAVMRLAARRARDAILDLGYYDVLHEVLKSTVEETQETREPSSPTAAAEGEAAWPA